MDNDERQQFQDEIADLKESHDSEIEGLENEISSLKSRIDDLQNAIQEIYDIAKRV